MEVINHKLIVRNRILYEKNKNINRNKPIADPMGLSNENMIQQLYQFISDKLTIDDFLKKIKVFKENSGQLLDDKTSAYLVLSRYERNPINIEDLSNKEHGSIVSVNIQVNSVEPKREYVRKDGNIGFVISLNVEDLTGDARVILWDTKLHKLIDDGLIRDKTDLLFIRVKFKQGDFGFELTPGKKSRVEILDGEKKQFWDNLMSRKYVIKSGHSKNNIIDIKDLYENVEYQNVDVKGTIKGTTSLREFMRSSGEKGFVINYDIYDGTAEARITLWDKMATDNSSLKIGDIVHVQNGRPKMRDGIVEIHSGYSTKIRII